MKRYTNEGRQRLTVNDSVRNPPLAGRVSPAYWSARAYRAEETAQPMSMSTRPPPPGPKGHFLLGNLPEFSKDLLGFITRCAGEYGDIVRLRLANRVAYLLNHPDYMEYVLVTNHPQLRQELVLLAPREGRVWERPAHERRDFWLRERRLCQPAFHREAHRRLRKGHGGPHRAGPRRLHDGRCVTSIRT